MRNKKIIVALIATILIIIFITGYSKWHPKQSNANLLFDSCILKELDPWDPEINQLLNHSYNPFENCYRTVEMATKLENGKLYMLDQRDNVTCWWQCLFPKDDYHFTTGGWNKLTNGSMPECDIIETNCRDDQATDSPDLSPDDKKFKGKVFYEFLHAQTYRKGSTENVKETSQVNRPDVHILVFDSVSNSHFIRAMTKTRHYLQEHFDAITFPYLNKVGINSRRNGLALLLGKTIVEIEKSPISIGYPHDCLNDRTCCDLLENGPFVGYQFKKSSYETLMSDDYVLSIPYQLRVEYENYSTEILKNNIYKGMCRGSYEPQIEYLKDLLDKFPDKPKFSLTWMTNLAHNDNNGLFHSDEYFYNFFKINSKKFENAYVFLMADHGTRFGPTRLTAAGEREDNNPFLMMFLPAFLRENDELQNVIRDNARQLVSHYDLYATFIDIVAPYRPENSSKPKLHGSSILKPLPQPRTCDGLRIPFEYCICDYPTTRLPDDSPIGREAGNTIIKSMNDIINTARAFKNVCHNLTLSSDPVIVESFNVKDDLSIFKVTFKVLPGEGHFSGYMSQNRTTSELSIVSNRLSRLDSYAKTAHCAQNTDLAAYCYCIEQ
uniref:Sulfatase domain-containing protein n=1 Tax=Panagrellus redivivus TaxID=6233 RepID=A0A7E4VFB4_PANRE